MTVSVPLEWAGQAGDAIIGVSLLSLAGSLALTPLIMPWLVRWKLGQYVRRDGPDTHRLKQGTPTMGGVVFVLSAPLAALLFSPPDWNLAWVIVYLAGFGALGFADDYLKVVLRRPLGLKARYKLAAQVLLAAALAAYAAGHPDLGSVLQIPWVHAKIDLGYIYPFFVLLLVLGTTNAANLTDGLDGLLAGTAVAVFAAYGIICLAMAEISLALFALAMVGGLLGFLWYNRHPARIFMGDTGSLAIGGALAAMAVLTKTELLLPLIGMIYVLEALSVILQVLSYRYVGRRLLRMSPIHHHFELSGWPEWRVVATFWAAGLVFALLGIWGFYGWGGV